VEVKARSSELFGGAVAAFDRDKRLAVARTAAAYLSRNGLWDRPCRFDLVTIERTNRFPWWRPRHIVGAFEPDLGRLLA
jgi:putative endonuclease